MYEFSAYGKNFTISINPIFREQYGLKCSYEHEGEEEHLIEPHFYLLDIDTKEKADVVFTAAIQSITREIQEVFGEVEGQEPQAGLERIEWLLKTKLSVEDNNLIIKW